MSRLLGGKIVVNIQTLYGAALLWIAVPAAAQQTTECRTDGLGVTRCETKPAPQGMNLNWDLLGLDRTPDFGEIARKGMEQGRRQAQEAREYQQRQQAIQEQQALAEQLRLDAEAAAGAAAATSQHEAEQQALAEQQRLAAGVSLSCTLHQASEREKRLGVTLFESQTKARVTHAGHTFMTDATFTPDTVSWKVGNISTNISRIDLSLLFDSPKLKDTGTCTLAERKF